MRIVLDTNILARANPMAKGPARKLLLRISESAQHVSIVSPFILLELERVLAYPRIQKLWPLALDEIADYRLGLESVAELVVPSPSLNQALVPRDPNDDPILRAAIAGLGSCTLHPGPALSRSRGENGLCSPRRGRLHGR